jgi:hypothetical protein
MWTRKQQHGRARKTRHQQQQQMGLLRGNRKER